MIEKKRFHFMTHPVVVEIRDKAPDEWASIASGGCYDGPNNNGDFVVWFTLDKGAPGLSTIAHESWHLFMTVMGYIDKYEYSFETLNSEIYAYNFHMLFTDVLNAVLSSKMYQSILEKEH